MNAADAAHFTDGLLDLLARHLTGHQVVQIRHHLKLSQEDFAQDLETPRSTLAFWETHGNDFIPARIMSIAHILMSLLKRRGERIVCDEQDGKGPLRFIMADDDYYLKLPHEYDKILARESARVRVFLAQCQVYHLGKRQRRDN